MLILYTVQQDAYTGGMPGKLAQQNVLRWCDALAAYLWSCSVSWQLAEA